MSLIEPFTPEGIDPNVDYSYVCIDRVNKKVNAIGDISSLTSQVATLTTKMDRSYIVINVKDYGAVGNGTTNDTTSINNAVSALPNAFGILYFPKGSYLISGTITFSNKNSLLIRSDNANIIVSQSNSQAFYFVNCDYLTFVDGSIIFTTTSVAGDINKKAIVYDYEGNNSYPLLKNIIIFGAFTIGIHINKHAIVYNASGCLTNITIDGNNTGYNGILLGSDSEYIDCSNIKIKNLLYNGIKIDGGNHRITSCFIMNCRIGCFIEGISANSDHGAISGCSINHNRACGLYIKNLKNSFNVINNNIWANNGPDNLTDTSNTSARGYHYGVYLENVVGVNLSGNIIAHNNNVEVGWDGLKTSIINNNVIKSVSSCLYPFYEWTNVANTSYNNQICNNTFNGSNTISPGGNTTMARIHLGNMVNDGCYNYLIKDNTGENWSNDLLMAVNSGDYYIGIANNYVIDGLTITTTNSTDPAGQTANIYILPHATGTEFKLIFRRNNISGYTWVRYKTNNTTTITPYITSSNIIYNLSQKAFRIGPNNIVSFTPQNNSTLGNWVVSSS